VKYEIEFKKKNKKKERKNETEKIILEMKYK
jgi:hypothetical protein